MSNFETTNIKLQTVNKQIVACVKFFLLKCHADAKFEPQHDFWRTVIEHLEVNETFDYF